MVSRLRILLAGFFVACPAIAATCEDLTALSMPGVTITSSVASRAPSEFCRVKAVARPGADSEIQIEVWLPSAASWNGKLLGTGNGGYSGALSIPAMQAALNEGYAVAGSDTGHPGDDLRFGQGHPEKIADWAWRAVHVMTDVAKLTARNYYGKFPGKAYFSGCSTGGQQALSEAQRFPADYDGIVAGDPGNDRIHLNIGFLWSWLATHENGAEILPAAKLPMITRAVIARCDAMDGVKDGLIDDPRRCHFDPATLLCKSVDGPECLTARQAAAVRKVYDGAINPRTHERIFPGWVPGTEAGWRGYFVGHAEPARVDFWRLWLFGDLKWAPATFDFDRDVQWADEELAETSALNADLRPFRANQGKLILYQGWADPVVPPEDTIQYFDAVQRAVGGRSSDFARLFMVPGMGHCQGGPGPSVFDPLAALDAWVTKDAAPDRIVAAHRVAGKIDRTRPLCPYPQVARRQGNGDIDDAASFACVAPPR
ncbi:MAG TPA: tannase/feruloyl esterase family alpha/beta hydrolase [Bryobacteraceae bacterium]|nr:tannase/feruloyl esterase family alpha/beta hydrolase [Bryobacteraceae bacterium]